MISLPPGFDLSAYVADYMLLGSLVVSIASIFTALYCIKKAAKNI